MAATWIMPSRAATWWHWATASDSIQLVGEAKTVTVAELGCGRGTGREGCADKNVRSWKRGAGGRPGGGCAPRGLGRTGGVRQNVMAITFAGSARAGQPVFALRARPFTPPVPP